MVVHSCITLYWRTFIFYVWQEEQLTWM
uniref:Uncharacterized protein n=1 Tax=Arundo donax TaxID=35708 RepID=A0A0A9A4B6_ARUDO